MYSVMMGAASGIGGVLGLGALYMGLAGSRMGIVAPLAGVISAMLPVFFGMLWEGLPSNIQITGFSFALAAIWFLSAPEKSQKIRLNQLGYPIMAGVSFGLSFILVDQAVEQSVLWPLAAARGMGITLLLILMFIFRKGALPQRNNYPLVCLAGIFETAGNTFYALAAHTGRLDIAAVLSSMYPVTTVILACLILKEHLSCRQWVGVITALTALVLIAA
jgi:drug/metabolite transporter (DMT)-like permease